MRYGTYSPKITFAATPAATNETALARIKGEVEDLCREFPLYPPPA